MVGGCKWLTVDVTRAVEVRRGVLYVLVWMRRGSIVLWICWWNPYHRYVLHFSKKRWYELPATRPGEILVSNALWGWNRPPCYVLHPLFSETRQPWHYALCLIHTSTYSSWWTDIVHICIQRVSGNIYSYPWRGWKRIESARGKTSTWEISMCHHRHMIYSNQWNFLKFNLVHSKPQGTLSLRCPPIMADGEWGGGGGGCKASKELQGATGGIIQTHGLHCWWCDSHTWAKMLWTNLDSGCAQTIIPMARGAGTIVGASFKGVRMQYERIMVWCNHF